MDDRATRIQAIKDRIAEFVRRRDWERYQDPKSLALSILIEAAELAEHFQWAEREDIRHYRRAKWREIEDELTDVLIYCIGFANANRIDLTRAIGRKLRRNQRKYPLRLFNRRTSRSTVVVRRAHQPKRRKPRR